MWKTKKIKFLIMICFIFLIIFPFLNGLFYLRKDINPIENQGLALRYNSPTPSGGDEFISIWDTTKDGFSNSSQIRLPLMSTGIYNFTVEWGDGKNNKISIWNDTATTHNYATPGIYNINISGFIKGWCFNNQGDKLKILEILQWGCLQLGNTPDGKYFNGCENLNLTATDNLNLNGTTILSYAFDDCCNLGSYGNINGWDVSNVKKMDWMFSGYPSTFNMNISAWNTSNVRNMRGMFSSAGLFNQPIGNWDVSRVTDMFQMFLYAYSFNQPLRNWNTSSVENMVGMFRSAHAFNQPIGNWDVSSVTDMKHMFFRARSFNQPIGNWDVSSVTDMEQMFFEARSFDQTLGTWNISNVLDMFEMFEDVTLSTYNYDDMLIKWSKLSLQSGISFFAGNSKYSIDAVYERQKIIDDFNWIIVDGGLEAGISGYHTLVIITTIFLTVLILIKRKVKTKKI
ncbi:MAG: BspA family leucine-rich repeat surface protein [Candidatus Lokiarchaeota archaeon]|nr:BspA family leucine-rich repeat surface protein [Candidatus Lokiarchaeota archaeon]MBD3200049.1 BspA family leucine-rich repeat surface protein [Candidatus Lokiarchaeota archaeon]